MKETKVVINARYGGFRLSEQAARWLRAHGVDDEWALYNWSDRPRHDPLLVECVETLGPCAGEDLRVVVAHGDRYFINEYDGLETVIDDTSDCWVYV